MAEISEANNRDMYKSYIQRRRVVPGKTEQDSFSDYDSVNENASAVQSVFGSESGVKTEKSAITDAEELSILREKYRSDNDFSDYTTKTEEKGTYSLFRLFGPKSFSNKTYTSYTQPQIASRQAARGRFSRTQSNRIPVEDNRTALLAIKIIKQTLACFAVLGIIVFMQQNVEMADELSFVKKHVVENHIELDNIINGVKGIIAECSRFLGGFP